MQNYQLRLLMCSALITFSTGCQANEGDNIVDNIRVSSISLSEGEKSFTIGDFNNDNRTDLVVSEEEKNRVVVLLNDSDGGLKRTTDFPAGSMPTSIQSLDFNRDGKSDIVIANHEAEFITLLQGQGDGTFQKAAQYQIAIETEPHSHMIDVADFNSDGFADIIVDSRDRLGAFILLGQEDGNFIENGEGIDVGGSPYLGVAVGEINNDGKPDIVTPNNQSHIAILLNSGGPGLGFSKAKSLQQPSVFSVAMGDINGDGNADLVAANQNAAHSVTLFIGDGKGDFTKLKSLSMAAGAKQIAVGDMNGDGMQDAVVTSWNSDALLIIGRSGNPAGVKLKTAGLNNPWSVIFADFDGDGVDEIIVGDANGPGVNIYSLGMVAD